MSCDDFGILRNLWTSPNFLPNLKFKISQLESNQLSSNWDFCLGNFRYMTDLNLKLNEKLAPSASMNNR
jgi:hypothetical protein